MKYVYILESLDAEHFYVGIADDVASRLANTMPARFRTPRNFDLGA